MPARLAGWRGEASEPQESSAPPSLANRGAAERSWPKSPPRAKFNAGTGAGAEVPSALAGVASELGWRRGGLLASTTSPLGTAASGGRRRGRAAGGRPGEGGLGTSTSRAAPALGNSRLLVSAAWSLTPVWATASPAAGLGARRMARSCSTSDSASSAHRHSKEALPLAAGELENPPLTMELQDKPGEAASSNALWAARFGLPPPTSQTTRLPSAARSSVPRRRVEPVP